MTQIARPTSDISVGGWSPYPADPTTLFDKINEVTPNGDTDYIYSSVDEDECEIGLGDVDDPEVGTDHKIRFYAKCPLGSGAKEYLSMSLVENGNVRATTGSTLISRLSYALVEYVLSEAEANSIVNYANLRLRFHIHVVNGGEPIQVTQAELEVPDAATEFVYGGDVPLVVLPNAPKVSLSKSYAGDIRLLILPGYSSARIMAYAGTVPLTMLPEAPIALLEKSFAGAIGLALIPNSAYELTSPEINEFVYAGSIPMSVLPSYSSILDRVYAGDIALMISPDFPKAILEKSYNGNISLIIVPNSIYEFLGLEFVYSGNIPLSVLPDYSSALDIIYGGDIGLAVIPTSDYGLKAFIEVVKTVFLKSRLTERLQELKSPIKPSIVLSSEIKPEGEE